MSHSDEPDYDPADHANYGFAEFPPGYHTKGADGKSPADRMQEILDRIEEPDPGENDYQKYRGKCKELSEAAVAADPSLRLVRGHYWDFMWGKQPHWWTVREDGSIFDPTRNQFPSKGFGEYEEFNGMVECAQCGREVAEDDAEFESNYAFCSTTCHCKFVGVYV